MAKFCYPPVRRSDVEETRFNTTVKDPYRWLEDLESEETKKFIQQQNALFQKYVESCPYRNKIAKRMKDLFDYPRYGCPWRSGSNYFFQMNTGLQKHYVFYIMRGSLDAKPEVFVDPNQLSPDGSIWISGYTTEFSHDGKWWVYGLHKSGSDWCYLKIKNVDTGIDLEEQLFKTKFSRITWTHDNEGFFYTCYPGRNDDSSGEITVESTLGNQLFYHKLGTQQSNDILIRYDADHPEYRYFTSISECGRYLSMYININHKDQCLLFHKFDDPLNPEIKPNLKFEPVFTNFRAMFHYITSDGPVHYFCTNLNAPLYRVARVDYSDADCRMESNWLDLIPEHPTDTLELVQVANNDILACVYLAINVNRFELRKLTDGTFLKEIQIPMGNIFSITAKRNHDELFFALTSFLVPSCYYHLKLDDPVKNEPRCFRESKPKGFDASKFVTRQIFYCSKDGTRVPMLIVEKKNQVLDGNQLCMLYGYGGYGSVIKPSFSMIRLAFFENLDGIFAFAGIRGGGEFGEKWHQDGKLLKKQNTYDDFISAAEFLIQQKYTNPSKLVISGGSNGGTLVCVAANQRPDLFGCVISHVGAMDMLRYHKFTMGYAWVDEFGDPDQEENFHNLIKHSPLHAIPYTTDKYPATLLLTADHDDRVPAFHALKFIAELQHTLGPKVFSPLMVRVSINAGHGCGKTADYLISEHTDIYCFMVKALNLEFRD